VGEPVAGGVTPGFGSLAYIPATIATIRADLLCVGAGVDGRPRRAPCSGRPAADRVALRC